MPNIYQSLRGGRRKRPIFIYVSKVKNTLAAPLASATTSVVTPSANAPNGSQLSSGQELRRPSIPASNSNVSSKSDTVKRNPMAVTSQANLAPPLVSLTPVTSEPLASFVEFERTPSQGASVFSPDGHDNTGYGTYIPGFPIQDNSDARSIRTAGSVSNVNRSASVSKVIRRIRGEGTHLSTIISREL